MKISCDIIRDILPLYAEDMVSSATREMVDDHLRECDSCCQELQMLRKPQKLPVQSDVTSLKRVGDAIRRRRILAVMAVFLFLVTLLVGGALMLDARMYLTAGEAVEEIYVTEDGVTIRWNDRIIGTSGFVDPEKPQNYEVVAWTNLYNYWFHPGRVPYEDLDGEVQSLISKEQYETLDNLSEYTLENPAATNFIYSNPKDHSMTLILNANQPFPEEPLIDIHSDTLFYTVILAAVSLFLFLGGKYFREKWYGELCVRIALITSSLAISVMIVTAGQLTGLDGDFQEAIVDSTVVALPMGLFVLTLRQLIRLNRQDKGL